MADFLLFLAGFVWAYYKAFALGLTASFALGPEGPFSVGSPDYGYWRQYLSSWYSYSRSLGGQYLPLFIPPSSAGYLRSPVLFCLSCAW